MSGFDPGRSEREFSERLRQRIHQDVTDRIERRLRRRSGFGGLLIGTILAGLGVVFLLQNLGIVYFDDVWQYWPVILIVLGVARAATCYGWATRIWGGAMAFAGVIFLLHNLDIIHGNVWNFFWPLILICVGLAMFARGIERHHTWGSPSSATAADNAVTSETSTANWLSYTAILTGVKRRITSQEIEGGEALAVFGGIHLDLRKAATKKNEIVIETTAVFGGIELHVPENWAVTMRGAAIFGGYEDKTMTAASNPPTQQPHLIITGVAVFGGVSVKN